MPRVVSRLVAAKASTMFADDAPILPNDDAIGIGLDFDRPAHSIGHHRVFVAVEANKAGLRHRRAHRMEAVEATAQRHEVLSFVLEDLPNRSIAHLRVAMRLGVGDTFVQEPGVQLVIALEPQAGCEEAFANDADLVLDLAFLPARRRRAGYGLDEIMPAHL